MKSLTKKLKSENNIFFLNESKKLFENLNINCESINKKTVN
jgi:hypothetical protein